MDKSSLDDLYRARLRRLLRDDAPHAAFVDFARGLDEFAQLVDMPGAKLTVETPAGFFPLPCAELRRLSRALVSYADEGTSGNRARQRRALARVHGVSPVAIVFAFDVFPALSDKDPAKWFEVMTSEQEAAELAQAAESVANASTRPASLRTLQHAVRDVFKEAPRHG